MVLVHFYLLKNETFSQTMCEDLVILDVTYSAVSLSFMPLIIDKLNLA